MPCYWLKGFSERKKIVYWLLELEEEIGLGNWEVIKEIKESREEKEGARNRTIEQDIS